MAEDTKIEWCDHTFNPWRGCTKVSPGCTNCYAETMSHRNPGVLGVWGDRGTRVVASDAAWRQPLKWDREAAIAGVRRRVFCASLADVFEDRDELAAPRRRLARLIWDTPNLEWLLLTKRPENARQMVYEMWFNDAAWPKNFRLGTTVENQDAANRRIPAILAAGSPLPPFLSVEPLLEWVDLQPHLRGSEIPCPDGIVGCEVLHLGPSSVGWVIVGGESGPNARPFDVRWARSIVGQCRSAGVPCFVKQMGGKPIETKVVNGLVTGTPYGVVDVLKLKDRKGGDMAEWPEDLRVREWPATLVVA